MQSHPVALLAFSVLLALITAAGSARADVESQTRGEDVWYYRFGDDPLNAAANATHGMRIIKRTPAKRVQLIRPRVHFVPELLKSVEHI